MPSTNARYRNVCFTLNNPAGPIPWDPEKMTYLVYQRELAPDTGTPHFQGYCEFATRMRLDGIKTLLGSQSVHIEPRRGTAQQASDYCKKSESRAPGEESGPFEHGTISKQGSRSDLAAFAADVKSGKRKRELIEDHLTVIAKYPKLYDTLVGRPQRTAELQVVLLIGPTGLGKSRYVYDKYVDDEEFYISPLSNGISWFDTYDRHKYVLLDDFAGASSHMTLTYLLRLLDRYPVMVPTKGSHTWWMPEIIYVTTNIHPALWYTWKDRGEQYKALARRFTKVLVFSQDGPPMEAGQVFWSESAPNECLILN